eukprot:g10258.t1
MLQSRRRLSVGRAILLVLLTSIYSVGPTQGIYARTEPGDPPTYCTVFHHMVKSAGSTMKNVLGDAALEDGVPAPGPKHDVQIRPSKGILSTYAAVGIVEHFNLSMELFNARVKSPVRDWTLHNIPVNAGRASGLKEDVLEWAKSSPEILRVVEADMLLYNYSMDIFKRQTAESLGTVWTE